MSEGKDPKPGETVGDATAELEVKTPAAPGGKKAVLFVSEDVDLSDPTTFEVVSVEQATVDDMVRRRT